MRYFSYQALGIFALQLSTVIAAGRPYYGASKQESKHEPENLEVEVAFENFRDAETTILKEEMEEVLSHLIPVALAAAVKRDDPDQIFFGIGESGWSIVQLALVHLSSILYQHDLTFIGGGGGMDISELWEDACAGGKRGAIAWHRHKRSGGNREASNTIAVCSSFFEPATSSLKSLDPDHVCKGMDGDQLMKLRSSILLRELAQTPHVGEGLRPRGHSPKTTAMIRVDDAQRIIRGTPRRREFGPVDVESFTIYVTRAWLMSSVCKP